MISYAQNFEDVILARALSDVKNGSYIDVGAHDPVVDSVTNHFYNIGWSGINIEPQTSLHEVLVQSRPRDTNLNLCIGDFDGQTNFATVQNRTGWSSSSEEQIKSLKIDKDLQVKIDVIEQKTLTTVLDQHPLKEIHFLKIDVEGNELQVISGIDFKRYKPWIMVVEATIPGSSIPNFDSWEPLLLESGYEFVYADGLNRFYLETEHMDLLPRFSLPPNLMDDFESQWTYFARIERDKALVERDALNSSYQRVLLENEDFKLQVADLQNISTRQDLEISKHLYELKQFRNSLSWKVTKPLRYFSKLVNFR